MLDRSGLHQKVQELCDCFAGADPLGEMTRISSEPDRDEAALKWVALAILHGINSNAKKISISKSEDGGLEITAKYRKSQLPNPGTEVGSKILQAVREITHLEEKEGKIPLALSIRDSSIEVCVNMEKEKGGETITIQFPK